MLLSIENEVVNAFIEPQFKNIGTANLVTIQFGAWESVPELRQRIQGDIRFDHRQRYFEFTGFTNFLTLRGFFIPMITLLRNSSLKALAYKAELAQVRAQNIDITNFESEPEDFKQKFGKNCKLASRQFQAAIKHINDAIEELEMAKKSLMSSEKNLRYANDKDQDVTIKRLTRGNPTMEQKFRELVRSCQRLLPNPS